eukprot:scaffold268063_cov32-Tisochrysis_lutea.AAC.2
MSSTSCIRGVCRPGEALQLVLPGEKASLTSDGDRRTDVGRDGVSCSGSSCSACSLTESGIEPKSISVARAGRRFGVRSAGDVRRNKEDTPILAQEEQRGREECERRGACSGRRVRKRGRAEGRAPTRGTPHAEERASGRAGGKCLTLTSER